MKDPINLDSIHINRTYAGCLEGTPSPEESIAYAKERVNHRMFWDGPVLVLAPEIKVVGMGRHGEERRKLPQWCHTAWLTSWTPVKEGDGSHLVVIWFAEEPSCDVAPIIEKIDWEKHAEDWEI